MKFILVLVFAFGIASSFGREIFRPDFSKSSLSAAFGGGSINWGEDNVNMWGSGLGIDVAYPAGGYSGTSGFGLYSDHPVPDSETAVIRYSVFFPDGFDFVKGGKIPGLWGGKKNCAGGDPAEDCFSTRLMWRADGKGELYLYANREAQDPAICEMPNNHCNPDFGWSLNRGAWTFKTGEYTEIEESVTMNTPGQRNGVLVVKINGVEKIRYSNLVFRIPAYPNMQVSGLHFATFFGGGSPDFASPIRQVGKFKGISLSAE